MEYPTAITPTPIAEAPVVIGIVRSDAMLFPLARLRDTLWTTLLGDSTASDTTRLNADARGLDQANWRAFAITKHDSFPLAIRSLAVVESHCSLLEGFQTNAPVSPFPSNTFPMPKSALALVGKGTIVSADRVTKPYDAEAARVVRLIDSLMESFKRSGLDSVERQFITTMSKSDLRAVKRSTTLFRHAHSGVNVYLFEAEQDYYRRVPLVAKDYSIAELIPFVSGWVVVSGSQMQLFDLQQTADDEDRKSSTLMNVLGIVELPGRDVWVVQMNGYEEEGYGLVEFVPGRSLKQVASVDAGGC